MNDQIQQFRLSVPASALSDLRERLVRTRWPERETVADRKQGVPLSAAETLCGYWRDNYDWRRCEARLNAIGQYRTTIDELGIHFLHIRSPEPDALPMILTHGWPGSIIEFLNVIGPLSDPASHGGDRDQAFHLVIPSLPGYGFSDRPTERGWSVERIAKAWAELMRRLGYTRYVAQGGDWGSAVTSAMAMAKAPGLAAIHLNFVVAQPTPDDLTNLTERDREALSDLQRFNAEGRGYSALQGTRPQTLGYALVDSPVGQAAWIYEKFTEWTDSDGDPLSVLGCDDILDNIMLYWLPGTGASSARLYWESANDFATGPVDLPVACSIFPREIIRPARAWAARKYANIIYWGEPTRGGHFAAFEQPDIFVTEVRRAFATIR